MKHKTFPITALKVLSDDEGIVEHVITVFGVVDAGHDVAHPGSFKKTLTERGSRVLVLDAHGTDSVNRILGKPIEIREVNRDELPVEVLSAYPEATGGVVAKTQFLLDVPEGVGAFRRIKAGALREWSYGYDALDYDMGKAKTKEGKPVDVRNLRQVRLWEYSPVLWGMNPATATLSAKGGPSEGKPYDVFKQGDSWVVYKTDEDGEPVGDPLGEHESEDDARAQVRALYAEEQGADDEEKRWAAAQEGMDAKAVWSAAYINDLPDDAFLLIEDGGEKDEDGNTVPRTLRHFPYKDEGGNIDLPHLQNAIGRIPQAEIEGFDDDAKEKLQARAQRILEQAQEGEKALNLSARVRAVEDAFCQQYNPREGEWSYYPHAVYDDALIVSKVSGGMFRVPYTIAEGDVIIFAAPDQWTEGRLEFMPDQGDVKEGRVLAGRNASRIRNALTALLDVLEDAGVDVPGYGRSAEETEETEDEGKAISPTLGTIVSGGQTARGIGPGDSSPIVHTHLLVTDIEMELIDLAAILEVA